MISELLKVRQLSWSSWLRNLLNSVCRVVSESSRDTGCMLPLLDSLWQDISLRLNSEDEGLLRIAQRFNVGRPMPYIMSPEGRLNERHVLRELTDTRT